MAGKSEPEGIYLRLPVDYGVITGLVYMPDVDAITVSTAEGSLLVYDAASFKRLFERKIGKGSLSCLYHCHSGRLVVTNGERLGARSARGGLLYLPTILQTTVSPEEEVVLEVPHEEAMGLLDCLRATTELGKWTSVKDSSKEQLLASLESTSSNLTARQPPCAVKPEWKFVDVHGTPSLLRVALTPSIPQGKVLQIPICHELLARELVLDREGDGEKIYQIESGRMGTEFLTSLPTSLNNMEALRKLSLVDWPLKDHRWATPNTLAAAGFHKSSKQDSMGWYVGGDNDLVTCFNCFKSLRSWEPCDEPWSEHTRHFPECSFITGQRTANVPLSVTMASTPATMLTHQDVAEEAPILSTSWGCPFVGVAWKNGTIVVYNVGHSFFLHQHCEVFRLSAEALMASLQFEETVSGERDESIAGCPQGGVLEKALDGIKVAIADLQDMESTMTSDESGSTGGGGPSVVVSACCVLQSSGCDKAVVEPAVVIGCILVRPEEARALLVAYTLQGRKVDKAATAFPATASLAQIVPIPTIRGTEGQSVTPTVTDIVPCAGGRFLAVNVVYREIEGQEPTGSTVQSAANDEGCPREADGAAVGGDGGNSSSHNITCSQTLLYEVAEEAGAKTLSTPRPTSLSQSPVVCKVSQEPGTRLVSLAEARRGGSEKAVHLVGMTDDGQVLELTGEKLDCRVVVSAGCDPVVLCAPCIGLDQLVVVRQSSLMELVSVSRERALASEEGGEGVEEFDCSPGAGKDARSEEERLRRIKSELSVGSVKAIHSLVTRIGEEGLPFVSWVPANWREISTEQKDRSLPQHVHQPTDWEKDKGKKMWMIPWRTDTVQSPLMVMELTKPQRGSIAQLNVQLQSEVTASLVSLSVSMLAVTEPSRSTEEEEGIGRGECGSGGETVRVVQGIGTGSVSFSETVSDTVDDLCRRSSSVCVCGPVKCADYLGIMQDEVTLALYHRSLQEPHVRKYLLVLEVCPGANVERATPLPGGKGKENVILSVAFLPSKVPLSLEETSHLGFVLVEPAFVQLLLVLAAGGKVLGEEFDLLCEDVQHLIQDRQRVEDVEEEPGGVRYSAMEVLCYLAGREVHQTDRSNCRVLLATVSPVLGTLLYSCVLNGTRNLAYRTSRFLRLCLRLARALCKDAGRESLFSPDLHRALLQNLPFVPSASCAVGMRCFCDLLGALQGPEELVDTVQGLLQVCGRIMDSVGNLSVAPVLHGMAAAETSVINLNFDPFMFDGGLPSLLCVSAESSNNKPSLEYSSINHNNEMKLFCNGGATSTDHSATGGKSFVTVLNSTDGNSSKGSNVLICSSMKMAPYLRQSQAGALESFEIAYTVRSFSHCEPVQSMKQGAKEALGPFPSLKSRNYLLRALLRQGGAHQGCAGGRASDLEGAAVPQELIEKIASKEPMDASTAKAQVTCLEESLFGNFDISGRKVEVASARSGQCFSVILDFHLPILLTDVCIPTNPLLSSVTVDVWLTEGESPSRVLHAKDLSCKSVSLGNLSPPPLCQFAKVTFAVGTGKSSPSLVTDLGLYCGQLVLPLLTPFVLHRLSQLTKQLQGDFAAVTEQLNAVLEYMVKAPPTAGDPVAMEMINLTKQMTRDAGSLQFTVSVLESMWSHAASQHHVQMCTLEPLGSATEPPGGAGEQTQQREYLIDPKGSTRVDLTLPDVPVPCNQWFSVARRLINKLTCLLARLKRAGLPSPSNSLTRQQAKNMFFALGLQCYAKVSARAMSVLVENCARSPWWPGLIQEIIQEVTHDQRPLLYDMERAFALLSGFIRRTSSTEIVDCLLCLLEKQFGSCQEEGDNAPIRTQERIARYHWLLTVFCDAISSLGLLPKISDLLPRERCCMVSKGIVKFIMKLVASSNPSSGQTVLVCCKAILLLCKTSSPVLTLSDVFGEESLLEYLILCCKNWGGGTGEGQSSTVWLTAMESVILEIFQMECVNAEAVISSRPVDNGDSDEPTMPVITQADYQDSQTPPEVFGMTGKNPSYNSEESDDEFIGYLAKKAGIDTTASYFTEEQYWPSKHMLHRYSRRKRAKTKEPPPPNDTDDPPYSTYIVSGCVDHRLGASFELLAEKDMQLAWKEEYRDTLHFVASCGCASLPLDVRKAEGVPASDPSTVLAGLKASQALLCTVLIRLAGRCSGPFSELSSVALVRLWWGVTQLTLFCKDKDIPSEAVSKSLFLLDQFLQFQAGREQKGVGDSKSAAADPAEVMSLSQLTCQQGFLPHIIQLISSSPEEADGLMQGLKLVTAILSAQVVLSSQYGTSPLDARTSIDLEPLGTTLSRLFRNQISHGKLQIIEEFIEQLLKYYEEDPVMEEEKEESTKILKCSGMLVVVERVAHFLSITEPKEALQSRALVAGIRQLLEFYQRASKERAGQACQRGQQERRILHVVYCSKQLERFKVAMKSLFESVMRAMLFHYGESGRERLTLYTQDMAMRRFHDPSRSNWTETPKAKAQMSHTVTSMCGMMNHLVQWESNSREDHAMGVWEDLTKTDAFIGMLLQVYLLCVSSKLEAEAGQSPSVLECVRGMVQQISTSRLVQPIIALLQRCGRDQVALLPHILELIERISSRDSGEVFMELLLGRRALEAAVEGFLDSCVHHLPSEPSLLKLPYIWHLFRVNGNEEMQNLSEFVLEPSHRVKMLLKGGRMRLAEGVLGVEPIVIRFKQPVIVHSIQLLNSVHSNGPQAVEVVAKTMEYSPAMSVTGVVQNPGGDSIKLELHSLPLVTELRIFMWRAHSANDIFLSGIVIIGHPFLSRPHTKVPTTAGPSNSWLLFLHWWLQQRSERVRSEVERNLGAQCVPLARGCLQLLTVGSDPTVLRLLVHLAGLSDDLSRTLVHGLLSRDRKGQFDPLLLLLRSISQEATMELLKLLCMSDTGPGMQRLDMMLQLSVELSQAPLDRQPHPLLLKFLASLVWQFQARPIVTLQDVDHTRALADFAFHLPMDSPLKVAYNALLCALCAHPLGHSLRRDLLEVAQKQFGAEAFTTNSSGVVVSEGFLSTLATLLQSGPAMEHFLQSRLADMVLLQLNQSLQELQTALSTASPWQRPATQHCLKSVRLLLMFVSSLAAHMQLAKAWLGREGAAQTWTLLLATATGTAQPGSKVEQKHFTDLAFEFFARCCEHYPANKTLLALLLKNQMESFTRDAAMVSPLHHRLLTSVVLGVDRIPVVIQVEHRNGNGTENTPLPPLPLLLSHHAPEYHPSLGAGGAAYVSFLPTTMLVDTLLASFSQPSGQAVSERAASKTSASITATALEMHNLDFSAFPDPPEGIVMPSPLQVVNWHTSTLKKLPRVRRRDTGPKPSSTSSSSSCQLGLRPLGKSPLFVPLACLTVGDLLRALDEAGLGENNPLALRLVYRSSVRVQDSSENGTMDATVKHLANSLQQCFRKKTKPSSCHMQPTAEGTPPHPPSPSLPHPPLGSILRLQMETGLLEIVAAILPQLYGSLWPRVAGMARAEHKEGSSVDDGLIASPPSGVPFHSVVMLGLGMGLSEVCVQLMSDTSMDALVMVKVVLGGNLSDVLSELNYTPANKKKFACLPYQIVEQVLSKGEPDQGLVEEAPCEGEPDQGLVEAVPCEGQPDQGLVEAVPCEGQPDQGLVEAVPREGQPEQGLVERCFAVGVLHHALGCIRHLGSHSPRDKTKDATVPYSCIFQSSNGGAELSAMGSGQKFFAKGTGFGSGSLRSGWDMEQVRETQKEIEQQVECCLKIFAAFMHGVSAGSALWERHPSSLHDVVASSALLPALASYLFNDSVLDMAQHVPLYLAVFAVVRSLSRQPHVVGLLLERPFPGEAKEPADSIYSLMEKMKATADRYRKTARLSRRVVPLPLCPATASVAATQPSTEDKDGSLLPHPSAPQLPSDMDLSPPLLPKGLQPKTTRLEEEVSDGVLQLMGAIESSWAVLQEAVAALRSQQSWEAQCEAVEDRTQKTAGEVYMEAMKPLQFDSTEMTTVGEDGKIACLVPYHYAGHLESVTEPVGGARAMRITQEITTLANSLPLSASSSVFIRCDEERVDVMKVLITGPADTPYANGCFVFDVFFPAGYPNHPMLVNLQTTGHRTVRFNPNLYADGKVCLSVLNTWSGRPEEKWNSRTSSLLQVLVSIQSLILVAEPYFNEPGYERQRGTPQGDDQNLVYNAVVFTENVRWAILEQIVNPAEPFRQVILQHFYLKQHEVLRQCREWRRVFAEAAEKKKHLTTVSAKLRILDSLLPQLERKLTELKPDQLQTNTSGT